MLAVLSPLRSSNGDDRDVPDAGNFLEDFSFDDIFVGFDNGDILPDLEVDSAEIFADFSCSGGDDESAAAPAMEMEASSVLLMNSMLEDDLAVMEYCERREERECGEEVVGTTENEVPAVAPPQEAPSSSSESGRGRKHSAAAAKGSHGKRKVKVDWTPELHRRFVTAVEQLGVDKAVPSRILELMGIDCLTRHNIASHLQKYRSHRKHMMAREAEAASWSQRRQLYAGGGGKRDVVSPWAAPPQLAPTIGFPPPPPAPPPPAAPAAVAPFRPLHVWGHPTTVDQVHLWPRHLPPPPWAASPVHQQPFLPPPTDPSSYWHQHFQIRGTREGWIPHAMTQGTPCFPQPLPTARFQTPPVHGIVPHPMYRPVTPPPPPHPHPPMIMKQTAGSNVQLDTHPSKESIDAAIGDVLAKPWLPLPLGLKPPSVDSVLVELQKQGVSKVPPTSSST